MAFEPKTKKVLTRSAFKLIVDEPMYIRIEGAMFVGKERIGRDGKKSDKEPPTVMNVTNLATGEEGVLIANTVIKSTLDEEYPSNAYVGKCFGITKQKRKEGKQYDPFNIVEIEDPADAPAPRSAPHQVGMGGTSSRK